MSIYLSPYKMFFRVLCGFLFATLVVACSDEERVPGGEELKNVYMSVAVSAGARAGTINTASDYEDRVNTVRLMIFDSYTGDVIYNSKHAVADFVTQPTGAASVWHSPFKVSVGVRDFYFVANEKTDNWDLEAALNAVTNRSELYTNALFTQLDYKPTFKPTAANPMIMTQCYRNIVVSATSGGKGEVTDPLHFVADGDEQVELIRTLAKVQLRVRNAVKVVNSGGNFVPSFNFNYLTDMANLALGNVPQVFSLFGNPYFGHEASAKPYTTDWSSPFLTENVVVEANPSSLTASEVVYNTVSATTAGPVYYDYLVTRYIPEYLRQSSSAETTADLKNVNAMKWNFNNALGAYYVAAIDHGSFNNLTSSTSSDGYSATDYFAIPNPGNYSRYSVLRNTSYEITATERQHRLLLEFTIKNWDDYTADPVYVGDYYNVVVDDNTFASASQKVRIITSMNTVPLVYNVEVKALTGSLTNLSGGPLASAVHTNRTYQSSMEFNYNLPTPSSVVSGTSLLGIYFNGALVYVIKKP